jgi:hypothetical protein
MLDRTGDWCFEGGCTYMADRGETGDNEVDTEELETMYGETCSGMYD